MLKAFGRLGQIKDHKGRNRPAIVRAIMIMYVFFDILLDLAAVTHHNWGLMKIVFVWPKATLEYCRRLVHSDVSASSKPGREEKKKMLLTQCKLKIDEKHKQDETDKNKNSYGDSVASV